MNNQILDINKLENLYQLFERGAQIAGEGHPLYRFNRTNNKEESMVTVTYDEYLPFLQKMILAYQKLIKKGDKVVLIGETSVQWITTYMATVCAGGIIVPLDPGILDDEVINFTNLAEAKMVVSSKTWEKKHILVDRENEFKTVEHFVELDKSTFTTTSNETFVEGKNMTLAKANMQKSVETLYFLSKIQRKCLYYCLHQVQQVQVRVLCFVKEIFVQL